jgi:hypothetical protein
MKSQTRIGLKHSMAGLLFSALAAVTVVFALKTYAGPIPPLLIPCASAFAVFVVMNRRLWQSTKESYDAGEVGRRMSQSHASGQPDIQNTNRSHWFENPTKEQAASDNHVSQRKKKALQAAGPEGLI